MKSNNQLKSSVILTYATIGLGFIIYLFYTPIMILLLGQSEYGLYNLAASIIAYMGILNFGFGSTYIRFYSNYKNQNDDIAIEKLNGIFVLIFTLLSIIVLIAGIFLSRNALFIFGDQLSNAELTTASKLLVILTINLVFSFANIIFIAYVRANEHFVFEKIVLMIKTILNPLFVLPMLLLGYGSVGMALSITFLSLIIDICFILYAFKKLKIRFRFRNIERKLYKELLGFSFFIFINLLIDQVNWNVDKIIIGRIQGTISVAIYSLASLFNTQFLQLSTAISSVFTPKIHRLVVERKFIEISDLFIKVGRIQFYILLLFASGFIVFGKQFILLWAGEDYLKSYYIIVVLIISVLIPLIQNLGIEIQRAMNLHKFRSIIYLIIAVANISISIPLVMKFDSLGAAFGTAIASILGAGIIMNIYYIKKINLDIKRFWNEIFKILPILILPVLFSYIYHTNFSFNSNILYLIIGILIYTLLYALSAWFLIMNKFEKKLVSDSINRIFLSKRKD